MSLNLSLRRRAKRALQRQLEYQCRKSAWVKGHEQELIAKMTARSRDVRQKLDKVRSIPTDAPVLEVGCGAHGLIFFFGAKRGVGIDPLADHYATLFPAWQGRVATIAALGEHLPFEDKSFGIVLCDNVVDHAENPRRIMEEIARVLVSGGLLYFEVNVHHPFYHVAASLHAAWRALGIPFEIAPFADHTFHLTVDAARQLFVGLPLRITSEDHVVLQPPTARIRHAGDQLKRLFFKNAQYEVIAVREQ